MARIDDLKARSDDQLTEQLGQLKREQFNLRFQRATGQAENAARVKQVRRDIARIKTIQNERTRATTAAQPAKEA